MQYSFNNNKNDEGEPRKDEIYFISRSEHSQPFKASCSWMEKCRDASKYKTPGPVFIDGSINWQCPCMGGGSLVAHRCGHHFRKLYECMKDNDNDDAMMKCPEQFIDWATCIQNLNEKRRQEMRRHLHEENQQKSAPI